EEREVPRRSLLRGVSRRGMKVLALAAGFALVGGVGVTTAHAAPLKPRTIVTTDGEEDDQNSMIRYLMYANQFDTLGLVYAASRWHWLGDGHTVVDGRTTYRWYGTQWIQDQIAGYAQEYPNLVKHDPNYPTPESLLKVVKVADIIFPGEMSYDTEGSDL